MAYKDFMNKIRYWDNVTAKWMMRHFYFMFFQLVLVVIFFFWLTNTIDTIETSFAVTNDTSERILLAQAINTGILVLIVILNSFWLLYIFSSMQRMTTILKDICHHISRLRIRN